MHVPTVMSTSIFCHCLQPRSQATPRFAVETETRVFSNSCEIISGSGLGSGKRLAGCMQLARNYRLNICCRGM